MPASGDYQRLAGVDLAMSLALIVIPNRPITPGEHRSDGQQVFLLPRLANPALRVDQRNAVAAKLEPGREIGGIERRRPGERQPGSRDPKPLGGVGRRG
jgi:hypothetical protein